MGSPQLGQPPAKKSYKLPGFFDFTPPPENPRPEYTFEEWNGQSFNPEYLDPPKVLSPFNQKVQSVGHKYWGEVFAAIQPIVDFVLALFLELISFVARISDRLISGTILRLTDLFLKPVFVIIFNALIMPPFVLLANTLRVSYHALLPLFEILQRIVELATVPLRAIRLVEIRYVNYSQNPPNSAGPETKPPILEEV